MTDYKKESTSHILGMSANLIGVCLIIITGLKVTNLASATFLDEIAAIASILFLVSGGYAYLSMRHGVFTIARVSRFRDIADYAFLAGMFLLGLTVVLFSFHIIG